MARAVELGAAVPLPKGGYAIPPVPHSPECYALKHPDRIKKFPLEEMKFGMGPSADSVNREWRQELDHDAESVFWLILFWSTSVQPNDKPIEGIRPSPGCQRQGMPTPESSFRRLGYLSPPIHSINPCGPCLRPLLAF
jgi:hypothetical protein